MTTRVTISTLERPVKITHIDKPVKHCAKPAPTETVPPHSERTVYIHLTRAVRIEELPRPIEGLDA
jgi:hypothetical protein